MTTPANNGPNSGANKPEDDDPFGYLYADGQAAGATPPTSGGGYGYPGPTGGGQPGAQPGVPGPRTTRCVRSASGRPAPARSRPVPAGPPAVPAVLRGPVPGPRGLAGGRLRRSAAAPVRAGADPGGHGPGRARRARRRRWRLQPSRAADRGGRRGRRGRDRHRCGARLRRRRQGQGRQGPGGRSVPAAGALEEVDGARAERLPGGLAAAAAER